MKNYTVRLKNRQFIYTFTRVFEISKKEKLTTKIKHMLRDYHHLIESKKRSMASEDSGNLSPMKMK